MCHVCAVTWITKMLGVQWLYKWSWLCYVSPLEMCVPMRLSWATLSSHVWLLPHPRIIIIICLLLLFLFFFSKSFFFIKNKEMKVHKWRAVRRNLNVSALWIWELCDWISTGVPEKGAWGIPPPPPGFFCFVLFCCMFNELMAVHICLFIRLIYIFACH